MTPLTGFNAALERADHLVRLYELICDTRQRGVRRDWATAFLSTMRWPATEQIVRIDGKDKNSVLVFREACGITREHFTHDYLSELLRSAVVASVSALDRLMHDHIVKHSWKLLTRNEAEVPSRLKSLPISAIDARKALEQLRKNSKARPGNAIKKAIQERLHRDFTFQSPDSVLEAAKILGINDFWSQVASKMPNSPEKSEVISTLRSIANRRNQIVHEADLVRTHKSQPSLRPISHTEAREWCTWMRNFGQAVDEVISESL